MTPSMRGLRSRKKSSDGLVGRLGALADAVEACDGRVDAVAVETARSVIERADKRLALSGDATVVALAGATGSGKSSTFNALSGTDLATVGVRRPTTAHAMACTWGTDSAEELLDWLAIPRRHAIETDPVAAEKLAGLVLLDLPDHDSTEVAHRLEVDRLVQLVDVLIWVLDPQKYADAAVHDRYLRPLARHAKAMIIVLNQVDRLSSVERDRCLGDLRRLLDSEGLDKVEVLAVSALTGDGLDDLRGRLAVRVADKQAAAERLSADVDVVVDRLTRACGERAAGPLERSAVDRLDAQVATAAGVPVVADAVGQAWRLRGGLATGWPVLSWLAKFKPDPLRRLHLDRLGAGGRRKEIDPSATSRTSLPAASGVQRARVDSALRALADEAGSGLSRGWTDALKRAARANEIELADRVDRAVARTDLDLSAHRRWWAFVRVLQWLLVAVVVAGLVWLGVAFVMAYLQLPPLPEVTWRGLPAPTVLVVGGVVAGLVLAGLSRVGVEVGARRRARRARQLLAAAIAQVTADLVVDPLRTELERYDRARAALVRARGAA